MKKKFKLIADYPGCNIGVGDIIESHSSCTNLYTKSGNSFDKEIVESYPEFWEEIKEEKEYEVLEFRFKNEYSRILNERGEYVRVDDKQEKQGLELESLLNVLSDTAYYISSIKRLSDNEIFSIGDIVYNPKLQLHMPFIITKFYFDCNNEHLLCNGEHCGNGHINITKIEHYKELPYKILKSCPIEGTIYSVERISDREIFTIGNKCQPINYKNPGTIEKFEFVLEDQLRIQGETWYLSIDAIEKVKTSLFITEDGKAIYLGDDFYYVDPYWNSGKGHCTYDIFRPIEGYKQFSSLEAAKLHIEANKPQYSKKELKNTAMNFLDYSRKYGRFMTINFDNWYERYKK